MHIKGTEGYYSTVFFLSAHGLNVQERESRTRHSVENDLDKDERFEE